MQRNYRGRLYKLFCVNVHWLVRGLWAIAKQTVDEFTLNKMFLMGSDFQASLHEIIDKESLEEKYGGKQSNKNKEFFPPIMI
jgi:hypothetical protein